jgi:hypothetical protein
MSIADKARTIPGLAAAEGVPTGVATKQDLPVAAYDKQTAQDIAANLKGSPTRSPN